MVALIPVPDPTNMQCFLVPLFKEVHMYGPLKRNYMESSIHHIERVRTTQRNHTLRVTRVLPFAENENEVEALSALRPNEWDGAGRPSCAKRVVTLKGRKFLVFELDVSIFLAAITCDMPQRDKTMCIGGTARFVGYAWCLFEVSSLKKFETLASFLNHV